MPGTFVSIGLNSPRMFSGASGFGSKVSRCEGPPPRLTWIAAVARPPSTSPAAAMRRYEERLRPVPPSTPIFRKSRRRTPSQYRFVAIAGPSEGEIVWMIEIDS